MVQVDILLVVISRVMGFQTHYKRAKDIVTDWSRWGT